MQKRFSLPFLTNTHVLLPLVVYTFRMQYAKSLIVILGMFFLAFTNVQAQTVIKYKLSSGESGLNQSIVDDCEAGYFCIQKGSSAQFLQNAFNLAVGISIAVAVVLLMFHGVALLFAQYGIGDMAKSGVIRAKGKEDLLNPVVGLIIVFCSVVVIRTLNPDLLTFPIFDQLNFSETGSTLQPANNTDNNSSSGSTISNGSGNTNCNPYDALGNYTGC